MSAFKTGSSKKAPSYTGFTTTWTNLTGNAWLGSIRGVKYHLRKSAQYYLTGIFLLDQEVNVAVSGEEGRCFGGHLVSGTEVFAGETFIRKTKMMP